jgi:hypothetical protein
MLSIAGETQRIGRGRNRNARGFLNRLKPALTAENDSPIFPPS